MSKQLIDHSPDLKKLRDEGYNLEINSNYLLLKDVPYVNPKKEVKRGILITELTTSGDRTGSPKDHVVDFCGDVPCDQEGKPLDRIINDRNRHSLADNLIADCKFSSKPTVDGKFQDYIDYYDKMTSYANILSSYAQAIEPGITAKTYPVLPTTEEDSVFEYLDSASSRAGISLVSKKLELSKIAIIGLGGTGSYVFDLVAKTPVKEIHLFDGDDFLNHNAFRAPGAASVQELKSQPKKVKYLKDIYSKMRRGLFEHQYYIDESNADELKEMSFVFLCMDASDSKKLIVENLEKFNIPFIDTGLDVGLVDDSLNGIIRVTTNTIEKRDHFRSRVSLADPNTINEYEQNIQIADLNCLNAAFAVIKWKKLFGFYLDFIQEFHSTYTVDCNSLTNDESICE
jgi:hypothetical protein